MYGIKCRAGHHDPPNSSGGTLVIHVFCLQRAKPLELKVIIKFAINILSFNLCLQKQQGDTMQSSLLTSCHATFWLLKANEQPTAIFTKHFSQLISSIYISNVSRIYLSPLRLFS